MPLEQDFQIGILVFWLYNQHQRFTPTSGIFIWTGDCAGAKSKESMGSDLLSLLSQYSTTMQSLVIYC
jgi:hypothetical protein